MNDELGEIKASLKRIETGLFGDEQIGVTGIVSKQRDHDKRISSLEQWRIYLLGGCGAVTLCWGVFVTFFKN